MESLGVNPVLILAQIISFLIIYFIFSKFLYPKIRSSLKERSEAVSKTFSDKQEIEKRLANLEIDMVDKRKEMEMLKKTIEIEAKKSGEEIIKKLTAKAKMQSTGIMEKTQDRIQVEYLQASDRLRSETKEFLTQMVRKVLQSRSSDHEWQQAQLDKSLKDLDRLLK
jgi:F-type H+-transporting ATPase subunit b